MPVARIRAFIPLVLMLALLPAAGPVACGSGDPEAPDACACTEEFRSFTVKLVDSDGSPLRNINFDVTILRTGEKVNVVEMACKAFDTARVPSLDGSVPVMLKGAMELSGLGSPPPMFCRRACSASR